MVSWFIWRCCSYRLFFAPAGTREGAERVVESRSVALVACRPVHRAPRPRVLGCKEARGPAEDALCAGGVGTSGVVVFWLLNTGVCHACLDGGMHTLTWAMYRPQALARHGFGHRSSGCFGLGHTDLLLAVSASEDGCVDSSRTRAVGGLVASKQPPMDVRERHAARRR